MNKKISINTFVLPTMKRKVIPYNPEYERDREYERDQRRVKNFIEKNNCLFVVLFVCFPVFYLCSKCMKKEEEEKN